MEAKRETIKGMSIPNYEPTPEGWAEWEKNYNTGDGLFFNSKDFWDFKGQLIQVRGIKFPSNERYKHVEPVIDGDAGETITADGTEVRRQNVDNNRQEVFDHKLRIVIYRAMPLKNDKDLKAFTECLMKMLYAKYDTKKIWGMIATNFINFWNWICRKPDAPNTVGDPKLPVCCDTLYESDMATGKYKIMEGVNEENIDPSNLAQDKVYVPIASIG